MRFNRLYINEKFLLWGWLIPAVLPFVEIVGRAPLNIVLAIYFLWGLFVLFDKGLGGNRLTRVLYVVLLVAFSLGLYSDYDPLRSLQTWLKYAFLVLTYFLTSHALKAREEAWREQFRLLAIVACMSVFALIARGLITSDFQNFVPFQAMLERNIPFLTPFFLFSLNSFRTRSVRWLAGLFGCGVFLTLIVYSGGRSALVAFVVALAVYGVLALRLRFYVIISACLLVVLLAGSMGGGVMFRRLSVDAPLTEYVDKLSSQRTLLWRQALEHPPENSWVGVGMRNVRYSEKVITKNGGRVKHLHNFVLDTWYETGFIGLIAYFSFISLIIIPVVRNRDLFRAEFRQRMAPVVAGVAALYAGGMLSFSYYSPQLTVYLFFLLATLTHFSGQKKDVPILATSSPMAVTLRNLISSSLL